MVNNKVKAIIKHGMTPILCVGETLDEREAGSTEDKVLGQVKAGLAGVKKDQVDALVIAYEPIWAIGTGRNASGAMVAETVLEIRHALERFWPARFASASILYGGSVTPDNVADLMEHGTVDGFLVGGASLDARKFLAIHAGMR